MIESKDNLVDGGGARGQAEGVHVSRQRTITCCRDALFSPLPRSCNASSHIMIMFRLETGRSQG